jgi:hypothetical protein
MKSVHDLLLSPKNNVGCSRADKPLMHLNTAVHDFGATRLRNTRAVFSCNHNVKRFDRRRRSEAAFEVVVNPEHTCILCLPIVRSNPDHIRVLRRRQPLRCCQMLGLNVQFDYKAVMAALRSLGIEVDIWEMPVEVADAIPFDRDTTHNDYDADAVRRLWRILLSVDGVFNAFRSRFVGKSSPVHFFWGSFDLAVSRFSGRRAPERSDPDPVLRKIMQEAYSHEVISAGWWPGSGEIKEAAFYCYAAPAPSEFEKQPVRPSEAFYHSSMGEYLLMYDDVRRAKSPTGALLEFLQSTYEAGATTGKWDRAELEVA